MKFSKKLNDKIAEYHALKESMEQGSRRIQEHNEKVAQQLSEAEAELKEAIEQFADDPTEENRQKENEARRKVAALKLENGGAQERSSVVFRSKSRKMDVLRREILQMAKAEARENYEANKPDALKKIEDAKEAYLLALKGLYDLTVVETQQAYYDISREIGAGNIAKEFEPGVSMHMPLLTWRDPGYNYYGISETEVTEAFKYGIIRKGSIRD